MEEAHNKICSLESEREELKTELRKAVEQQEAMKTHARQSMWVLAIKVKTSEMAVKRMQGEMESLKEEMERQLRNVGEESEHTKNEQDQLILRIEDEKEDILNQK